MVLILLILVLLLLILVSAPGFTVFGRGIVTVVNVHPALRVYLSSWGRARWVGGRALATVTTPPISQGSVSCIFPYYLFGGETLLFFKGMFLFISGILLEYASS